MPKYIFKRIDNDEVITLEMTCIELLERQTAGRITLDDGVEAVRQVALELERDGAKAAPARRSTVGPSGGDQVSMRFGVSPEQVPEARAKAKELGCVGLDYDPKTGDAIFSGGRKNRDRAILRHGFRDRDSFTH